MRKSGKVHSVGASLRRRNEYLSKSREVYSETLGLVCMCAQTDTALWALGLQLLVQCCKKDLNTLHTLTLCSLELAFYWQLTVGISVFSQRLRS